MDELRERFGRLVAANRKRKGWTQQQLAEHSGVSHDMINRIERGVAAARFPNIGRLAQALEIDPAELFTPDLPTGAKKSQVLNNLVARLSALPDHDLEWIDRLLDVALKPRVTGTKTRVAATTTIDTPKE